jgi:hypothetical protein
LYGILRLRRTRAIWRRGVLWQADMLLLGGLNMGDRGQRRFTLVGGRVVGLLELVFLMLVVFWLLVLRVGVEQVRKVRHGRRRCCQRISRCGS